MSWTKSGMYATGDDDDDGYGASALQVKYRTVDKLYHSVAATSLSPVLLGEGSSPIAASSYDIKPTRIVRLYGIVPKNFQDVGADIGEDPFYLGYERSPALSRWGERYAVADSKRIGYLDSDPYRRGNFPGVVTVEKAVYPELYETCIISEFNDRYFTYTILTDTSHGAVIRSDPQLFDSTCGECQVLELPDNAGYLMVLGQYLYQPGKEGYNPYNSRTQIVGWWSDTKEFTSAKTVGPFLLVSELDCLPNQHGFRMWVGVPGIVAIRDQDQGFSLYLYYVVEESQVGFSGDDRTDEPLRDAISEDAYETALADWATTNTIDGKFTVGIACKRIDWTQFQTEFIAPELKRSILGDTTDIALWDTRDAVDGDLLGMVNFWFDSSVEPAVELPRPMLSVAPFYSVFSSRRAYCKAPHPVTCDLSATTLSLYTAVTIADGASLKFTPTAPRGSGSKEGEGKVSNTGSSGRRSGPFGSDDITPGTGHGIWRARALPEDYLLYNTRTGLHYTVVVGRDFVFSSIYKPTQRSRDMVAASDSTNIYIDPGPVQLEDGTWWVVAGRQVPLPGAGPTLGEMVAFAGTRDDGCDTWADLYPTTGKAHARTARRPPPAIRVAPSSDTQHAEAPHMTGDQIRASLLKTG